MRHKTSSETSKVIAKWLLIGVLMIIVQILLGGITRLTGSGLSITEWKPLLGAIPPLNEPEWELAFKKYQEIAQFKQLNSHFSLSDFKFIFFWEWFHRLWARLLGLVFLLPFMVFAFKGYFKKSMIWPLLTLFILGGLQGLIGWIMVKSGLNNEDLYVSHIRLAIHFIAALVLLVYTFWFALKLLIPQSVNNSSSSLKIFAISILVILAVQLTYGAFMAGLKAGVYAPTWPDINGYFIPDGMNHLNGEKITWFSAIINQPITIHFIHRNLAYIISILIFIWTVYARKERNNQVFNYVKWLPAILIVLQVVLGIAATLTSYKAIPQGWGVFEWMAQLHQFVAILLVLSLTLIVYLTNSKTDFSKNEESP
ncbi:MAG: COX15/CtaA family protein [Sphingobacteriaceae bacterium]